MFIGNSNLFKLTPIVLFTALAVLKVGTVNAEPTHEEMKEVQIEDIRSSAEKACEDGKQYRIAYSHSVSEAVIVKEVRHFADERAKELGCVTMLHDNTQRNSLEQQINAVQTWITQGVDAIVVTPIDERALAPFQKQAKDQGIKWLTYLGVMEDSDGYVGFDHAQSGELVANAAVEWVKENNIENPKAFITTLKGLMSLSPRWEEPKRIFEENGIEVVSMNDAGDQVAGMNVTETVLRRSPDLNIIIGMNDDAAVGANRAVEVSDVDPDQIFIAGQDGALEGLLAVDKGKAYRATAAIKINELGANVVDLALNAIQGSGPSFAYTPTVLATKSNQEQLEQLLNNYRQYADQHK